MEKEEYEIIVRKPNGDTILNLEFDDVCISVLHSWEVEDGWRKRELCYDNLTEEKKNKMLKHLTHQKTD